MTLNQILNSRSVRRWVLAALGIGLISSSLATEYYQIVNEPENKLSDIVSPLDCGVVLTGSSGRIREAFEALAQKRIKKLIIAGVYKEAQLNQIFPHLPFYTDVSEDDVILDKKSESTYGNAVQSLALVKALKCRNILLITSRIHMFRAHRIFQEVYPRDIRIAKMTVANKKDFGFLDGLLETVKSSFYWALGLVSSVAAN